jgi:acyl-CoA dehydrogenase
VDFTLPEHLPGLLADMDAFIEREIAPLQADNMQYFDQRREHARTDWDNDGIPTLEWEDLLSEMRRGQTKPAGCATDCRRRWAAATAPISTWR